MRKFKFEQSNSSPYKGLDGTVIFHDGTDPTHKILIESVSGLGVPSSSVQTQQAPYQIGASAIRVNYGPRTISLECAIAVNCNTTAGKASMEAIKRDLGKKFSPVGMGYVPKTSNIGSNYSTVLGKLSYAYDGTNYDRFIDCVPISCDFPNRSYSDGFQRFRLALFCPDPTWYGVDQESVMSSVPVGISSFWYSICWSPYLNIFCAVALNGTTRVMTSPDGVTWTGRTASDSYQWSSVCWSEELRLFVAVSQDGLKRVMTSPDGIVWTGQNVGSGVWSSVCWSKEKSLFVAVGQTGNRVMTSPDGIVWTQGTTPSSNTYSSVCWSKEAGIFMAVSQDGASQGMTSTDGISWSNQTLPSGAWNSVCWSPVQSIFCATAISGTNRVATSPDGVTWTVQTPSEVLGLYSVCWSTERNLFCAVSFSGKIITSSNGVTWSTYTVLSNNWVAVCWSQGLGCFIAVAGALTQYPSISYDGINWIAPASTDYLKEITNGGDVPAEFEIDIPVIGGETGKVVAIGDNFLWSGTGSPPSDHNLVFSTTGLKKGIVTVSTNFNDKDITQFGVSKFNLYQNGTFFSLYVSGATTNNIYVRNTGTSGGAPTIRWKNRYLGV